MIKSVAIIGAGAAGITTLYELLNTTNDQSPAFDKVVLFEQTDSVGGVWKYQKNADPGIPSQSVLNSGNYDNPNTLRPSKFSDSSFKFPTFDELKNASFKSPILKPPYYNDYKNKEEMKIPYYNTAIYKDLFTNVPEQYMQFSHTPIPKDSNKQPSTIYPLRPHNEMLNYLEYVVKTNNLSQNIRLQTEVESISKLKNNKWNIILRKHYNRINKEDEWYQEQFDSIIIATGHYNVPFIPYIRNLNLYNELKPNVIIHSKSFRNPQFYKNKNVLIVGSHISAIDILQYILPIVKHVYVSRNGPNEKYEWIERAITTNPKITVVKRIKQFNINKNLDKNSNENEYEIEFQNGEKLNNIDNIIFATGYHFQFPFFKSNLIEKLIPSSSSNSINYNSKTLTNFYLHTFNINDPTIIINGVTVSPVLWPTFEYMACAISSVLAGFKKLPTVKEQKKWEFERINKLKETQRNKLIKSKSSSSSNYDDDKIESKALSSFLSYPTESIEKDLFDPLKKLIINNRKPSLLSVDEKVLNDINKGIKLVEDLYNGLVNGRIPIEETRSIMYNDIIDDNGDLKLKSRL